MAEFVGRMIVGVVEILFEALINWTGKRVLSLLGFKSSAFVNGLIGLVVWVLIAIALITLIRLGFAHA